MSKLFANHRYESVRSCLTCGHNYPPPGFGTLQESPLSPSPLVDTYHSSPVPDFVPSFLDPHTTICDCRTMMMMTKCYVTINAFEYYVYLLSCIAFYMYVPNVEKTIEVG
jgi:hypothetical protein